jgi:hypothetical protein
MRRRNLAPIQCVGVTGIESPTEGQLLISRIIGSWIVVSDEHVYRELTELQDFLDHLGDLERGFEIEPFPGKHSVVLDESGCEARFR